MRVGALVGMASAVTAVGGGGGVRSGCLRYNCPTRRGGGKDGAVIVGAPCPPAWGAAG